MSKDSGWIEDDEDSPRNPNQALVPMSSEQPRAEPTAPEEEGRTSNQSASDDDSFQTQWKNTRAQVEGTFQRLSDSGSVDGALTKMKSIINPSRENGQLKHMPRNDDDSFAAQLKHTQDQVSETFKGFPSTFQQAGEMIQGAYTGIVDQFSSKKE